MRASLKRTKNSMLSSSLFTFWKLQLLKIALAQILFWARQSTNAQTALSSASSAGFESSGSQCHWGVRTSLDWVQAVSFGSTFPSLSVFLSEIGLSSWYPCQSTWQAFDHRCSDEEVMESLPFTGHPSGWIWQLRFPSFYWDSCFPKHHTFGISFPLPQRKTSSWLILSP